MRNLSIGFVIDNLDLLFKKEIIPLVLFSYVEEIYLFAAPWLSNLPIPISNSHPRGDDPYIERLF